MLEHHRTMKSTAQAFYLKDMVCRLSAADSLVIKGRLILCDESVMLGEYHELARHGVAQPQSAIPASENPLVNKSSMR